MNSTPCSGIYEFMRLGYYDCLKLERNEISGQHLGMFPVDEIIHSASLQKSHQNLARAPLFD